MKRPGSSRQFMEMTSFQLAARVATKKPATTASTAAVSQRERLLALEGRESASTAGHPIGARCLPAPPFSITVMPLRQRFFRIEEESALMAVKVVHVSD